MGVPHYGAIVNLSLRANRNSEGNIFTEVVFDILRPLTRDELAKAQSYRRLLASLMSD